MSVHPATGKLGIPASVRRGVLLICASLTPGLADLVRGEPPLFPEQPPWYGVLFAAFILALTAGAVIFILRGHNWARVAYSVFVVLGVLLMGTQASEIAAILEHQSIRDLIHVVATAMQLVAAVLFFVPEANTWFRAVKASRRSA